MFGNKILDFKDELLKDQLTVKRMTSAIMP